MMTRQETPAVPADDQAGLFCAVPDFGPRMDTWTVRATRAS